MSYEVKLSLFEGPFDLLLFFIERDELDIYDIPISKVTDDFFDYLKQLETLNIEVASEFILVASSLMKIKSKMLLPRPQIDEEGNEIDPREELVAHLLEYKRYKSVVGEFANMEETQLDRHKRKNMLREIRKLAAVNNVEAEIQNIDLFKIMKVYQKVLQRFEDEQNKPVHRVVQYPYTIANQKKSILGQLKELKKISFVDLIKQNVDKIAVIFNFLSILELLQMGKIGIILGEGYNNFWIEEKKAEDDAETTVANPAV